MPASIWWWHCAMMAVVCPSVCPVPDPKSRPEGHRKLKIGRKTAHDTGDPWPHLEVERSPDISDLGDCSSHHLCGILWRPPAQPVITGRIAAKRQLPVLFLLAGQKSAFSPCRGNSLHRFMWNLAQPRARRSACPSKISRQSVPGGGNAAPKIAQISTLLKESPHRGEPFDRFLQLLGAFMRPTILH